MSCGRVVGIYVATTAGAPCVAVESVRALEGIGLEGDRYSLGLGEYSPRPGTGRHVTLIDRAAAVAAGLAPGESRRNIETDGVDLASLVGVRFRLGGAELVGMRDCPPCGYLQRLVGGLVVAALQGRGGLRAEVVATGVVSVGDAITALR